MPTFEQLSQEILSNPDEALRQYRSQPLEPALLRQLAAMEPSLPVQKFLAGFPDTPSRVLEEIFNGPLSDEVYLSLINHPRIPPQLLQRLAEDTSKPLKIRVALAASKNLKPQLILLLLEASEPEIREALAKNSQLPAKFQARLSEDAVPFVRTALLSNPRLDDEVRAALADDTDPVVQAMALLSPKCEEQLLLTWADSNEHYPQALLLERAMLPNKVQESLCFSPFAEIQKEAVLHKTLSPDEMLGFAKTGDEEIQGHIASLSNLPNLVQEQLLLSEFPAVLKILAENPSISDNTAGKLAHSGNQEIQEAVKSNPGVTATLTMELHQGNTTDGLKQLLARPNPSQELLDKIYESKDEELLYHLAYRKIVPTGMPAELIHQLAQSPLPLMRRLAASAPEAPLFLLSQLARDTHPLVREALAANPSLPDSLRIVLEQQPSLS